MNEIDNLKNLIKTNESVFEKEITNLSIENENLKKNYKLRRVELKALESENFNLNQSKSLDSKQSKNEFEEFSFNKQDSKNEKKNENLDDEILNLQKLLKAKNLEVLELTEECQNLQKALYENKQPNKEVTSEDTSKSIISECSSISYRSMQDLVLIEALSETDLKPNPLLQTLATKKEPLMIYSNL